MVEASDAGSGLRELRATLSHAKGESTLAEQTFPGELLRGGAADEPFRLELELRAQDLGLKEGDALLRVTARDWSWRDGLQGNEALLEIPLRVDLTPPRIRVRSGLTYIRRGGSAAVIYDADEDAVRDGVLVDGVFFPGHPLPGAGEGLAGRKFTLFAVPRNAAPEPKVRVMAEDAASNRRTAAWATRVQERGFEEVRIKLTQQFLDQQVRELAGEVGLEESDGVTAFQRLNTQVRAANEEQIGRAHV